MKKIAVLFLFFASCLQAVEIEHYEERGVNMVPTDTVIEKLADGFSWVEGPAWNSKEKFLVFSDIPNNMILKWKQYITIEFFRKYNISTYNYFYISLG